MERSKIMVVPSDPYEYVIYNSLDKDKSHLEHKLSFHRLCTLLRRYDDVGGYSTEYWNKLFEYFCIQGEFEEEFRSIDQVEDCLTLEACVKRLEM